MTRPHDLECLGAVQLDATRRLDIQARIGVVDRLGEVHLYATEGLNHVDKAVEIQFDEMLDRYSEVLLNGGDQLVGALVQRSIDLVGAVRAGVGDEEITGNGQDRDRVIRRVEVENHDHVTVHAVDTLGAQAVGGVLHLECASVGRADHEDVFCAGVVALDRRRREVPQIDVVDLVIEIPAIAGGSAGQQHEDKCDRPSDPGQRPLAGPPLGRGVRWTLGSPIGVAPPAFPTPVRPVRLLNLAAEVA